MELYGTKLTFVLSVALPSSLGTRLNQTSVWVLTAGVGLPDAALMVVVRPGL